MTLLDQIGVTHQRLLRPSGGCHNCPRKLIGFVPPTLAAGPVLWLGEAPGATEVEEQEGFVGKSGQLMRREARAAYVPEPWSFSNTVHCRPPDNETPGPKEIQCCLSQFVLDEIRGYSYVVLVGAVPLQALFPGANAKHFRGNFAHHPDFPGQRFYAIYHPAYILRRPDLLPAFQRQLERLGRVVRGEGPPTWTVVRGQDAMPVLREALQAPVISLDLETTGNKSWEVGAGIKSLALTADGARVVAVHADEPHFVGALDAIAAYLQDPAKGVIGSHVAFDLEWLERDGEYRVQAQGVHDVGVVWYEAAQYKTPSLKQLVAEQLDGYRYLVHQPHLVEDVDLLLRYNAEDVVHSLSLFKKGMLQLRPRTRDLVTRVIGPMSLLYRRASADGLYIRQDYRRQKIEEYQERRKAAVAAWCAADDEFIPVTHEAGKGLADYLFRIKALPVIGETDKGAAAVDKPAIKQWIRAGATYLQHLLTVREVDKILSTYLLPLDKHIDPSGRIHPNHWLTWTDTSRPSSSDPNVYNVPQSKEIRDLYGAPPGTVIVESDLSQIEFRIMVCRAQDETGIAGYARGEDAHTMTARAITGNATPTKEQRSQAKPINFGFLYGASWRTVQQVVADDYGIVWTDREAETFRNTFMATYRRIPEFHDAARARLIANRGWFESVTGHVFHYADWNSEDQWRRDHAFRAALNSEAQGPAANICYYIAVLARRLLDARGMGAVQFVNSVYDSIMWLVPDPRWAPRVAAVMDEAAVQAYSWVRQWFVVPLLMEHAVGESWGALEKIQ